jgi:hypothetical protein
MTLLGIIGILLGLLALPFAFVDRSRLRIGVFGLAFVAHIASGIVYYQYIQTNASDASLYYFDPYRAYGEGFGVSTVFVIYVVQWMRAIVGGTLLDYFMLFQAIGFFGVVMLMRILEETFRSLDLPQPGWSYLLLFLPGLHFWTSAIGKDAPMFTACCLAIWAVMQVRRRYVVLVAAILLMIMIRPHIGLIGVVAAGWAVFADRKMHPTLRGFLVVASIGALVFAVASMRTALQVDVTDADSVSNFLERRDNFRTTGDDVGTTGTNVSLPLRVLSLLFRPMFIDATGVFGLIASVENLCLLLIILLTAFRLRTLYAALKAEPFLRFAVVSSVGMLLVLSIDYYNVGLGLRQKTMFVPGFLVAFVAVMAVGSARKRAQQLLHMLRSKPLPT